MRRTLAAIGVALLWGCSDDKGPRGTDAAHGYSVAVSYVLEFRRHFFPAQASQVCLAENGWSVDVISRGLRTYHRPIEVGCGADGAFPQGARARGIQVVLGPGPQPIRWAPIFDDPEWPHKNDARAEIHYSDSEGHDAVFSCKLFRSETGWQVETCDLLSVQEPDDSAPSTADIAGCWSFEWTPVSRPSHSTLPAAAALTLVPDSDWFPDGLNMAQINGTPLKNDWGLGWSWAHRGPYSIDLAARGMFEGLHVQLVWDRVDGVFRGVGSKWTDDIVLPELPDPDWRVVATRLGCS